MTLIAMMLLAAVAALTAAAVAHLVYSRLAERRHPPRGRFVLLDGALQHVLVSGSGPAVVLVHGANGTLHDFSTELIAQLAARHTVIATDRPGHGHSARTAASMDLDANARSLIGVLRALDVGPAVIVGHSYGAAVALRAALDAPELVRAVVAVTPASLADARNQVWALAGGLGPLTRVGVWVAAVPIGWSVSPSVRRAAWFPASVPRGNTATRELGLRPAQMLAAGENLVNLRVDFARLHVDLAHLSCPLTVIAGEADRITPLDPHALALMRSVPGARLVRVPDGGHWLMRQQPECVVEAVEAVEALGLGR